MKRLPHAERVGEYIRIHRFTSRDENALEAFLFRNALHAMHHART